MVFKLELAIQSLTINVLNQHVNYKEHIANCMIILVFGVVHNLSILSKSVHSNYAIAVEKCVLHPCSIWDSPTSVGYSNLVNSSFLQPYSIEFMN